MAFYTLMTYLMFLGFSLITFKKISHPIVAFNLIWSSLVLFSMLSITGIYMPRPIIYKYFLIGGFVFNVMAMALFVLDSLFSKNRISTKNKNTANGNVRYAIMLILNIAMLFYYIYKTYLMFKNVGSLGNYEQIRSYYYSTDNFKNSLEYVLVMYIFDPILYIDSIAASINLFEKKYPKYYTVLLITNLVLRMVISGGRMVLFEFGVCIVTYYFTVHRKFGKTAKLSKKKRRRQRIGAAFVITAVLIGAAVVTRIRNGNNMSLAQNVADTLISNFTGSFSFFSILNGYNKYASGLHGRVILAGLVDIVLMTLHFFKLSSVEIAQNTIGNILSGFYYIGEHSYNAMPTMYYFFITDFGKGLGVVLGPVILALYSFITDKRLRYKGTYKSFAIYTLMMLIIVESPMTWLPFKTTFIMANIFALLLIGNEKINSEEKTK